MRIPYQAEAYMIPE